MNCWQGVETGFGCLKKAIWLGCDDQRDEASTHNVSGNKGRTSQHYDISDQQTAEGLAAPTTERNYAAHGTTIPCTQPSAMGHVPEAEEGRG